MKFCTALSIVSVAWFAGSGGVMGSEGGSGVALEEAPVLNAQAILLPQFYAGPFHRVRDAVPTYAGANRYVVESEFGRFTAEGNALLAERVQEVMAIAQLREASKGEEYANAVVRAAKSPVKMARHLVKDPVGTVSSVPKGLWKFVNRTGQGIKEATQGRERSEYEDGMAQDLVGVSKAKRELAAQLGVNPYSSNEVLQEELNRMAWTSVAGDVTIKALTLGLSGGVAIAASTVGVADAANAAVRDMAPLDLRLDNEKRLEAMGVGRDLVTQFFQNQAFSPLHQTRLVRALEVLKGVKGRNLFLREAAEGADSEQDAVFFSRTAQLLARLYQDGVKMEQIVSVDGLPVVQGKDGLAIVALEWDYAAWTEMAATFAADLRRFNDGANAKKGDAPRLLLALSGDVSPRFQQEMESRGVTLRTRLDAPVLR